MYVQFRSIQHVWQNNACKYVRLQKNEIPGVLNDAGSKNICGVTQKSGIMVPQVATKSIESVHFTEGKHPCNCQRWGGE